MSFHTFAQAKEIPTYLRILGNQGIINAHENIESYELDRGISRAEALAVSLTTLRDVPNECDQSVFEDIDASNPNTWTCKYTTYAAAESRITDVHDSFRPNDPLSRAEALAFLIFPRCGDEVYENDKEKYTTDEKLQAWQHRVIVTALHAGVIAELDETDWDAPVTREEFFWWTYKVRLSGTVSCFWNKPITYYHDYKTFEKVIRVDTFRERLSYYQNGQRIDSFTISTGNNDHATPSGRFKITNKHPKMLSQSAGLWMPFWMEFYEGKYGFHALPVTYSGTSVRDDSVLGRSAPGGCVRMSEKQAQQLYDWADTETTVLIHHNNRYQP